MATLEALAGQERKQAQAFAREWVPLERETTATIASQPPGSPVQHAVEALIQCESHTEHLLDELRQRLQSGGVLQQVVQEEGKIDPPLPASCELVEMLCVRALTHERLSRVIKTLLQQLAL